jgi:hypothetical protein
MQCLEAADARAARQPGHGGKKVLLRAVPGAGIDMYMSVLVSNDRSKGAGCIRLEVKEVPNAGQEYASIVALAV